jgi:haloacetate dehalogenase
MFEGFADERIRLDDVTLRVRFGGAGPAVLLVHGHPRTGATWHRVAPMLVAAGFTVVCPDMRGYGASSCPAVRPDHSQQSKRSVAGDLLAAMRRLGHQRFHVAGHDRGCYVAMRLALDHPEVVARLAVLDGVPISEALNRCDAQFAQRWFHWFFFAQPDRPERAINADPDAWYGGDAAQMGEANYGEFRRAIHDPDTVRAMLEDYRAGLGIDRQDEVADRAAGRQISCPTLMLWSSRDDMQQLYGDPLSVWAAWAPDLRGHSIDSGHHMAEENPGALAAALGSFFAETLAR